MSFRGNTYARNCAALCISYLGFIACSLGALESQTALCVS